jgi:hypothetical protein
MHAPGKVHEAVAIGAVADDIVAVVDVIGGEGGVAEDP